MVPFSMEHAPVLLDPVPVEETDVANKLRLLSRWRLNEEYGQRQQRSQRDRSHADVL